MICVAKTFQGLENVLYQELISKDFKEPQVLNRAVSFYADPYDLYRANYVISTALRILKLISEENVLNEADLYNFIFQIPWHTYFSAKKTFRVDITLVTDRFNNSLFLAQKAKDAIVDRFRKELGYRPSVATRFPDIIIHIHVGHRKTSVFLDSSGESLNKRGYRLNHSEAPINEVLARGLIKLSQWNSNIPLLDIMCGSGTFAFEALYEACFLPSAYFRKQFSFMHWNDFDQKLWKKVLEKENQKIKTPAIEIIGLDINPWLIQQNNELISQFPYPLRKYIHFSKNDFLKQSYTFSNGFIISNLPYNERIKVDDLKQFYHDTGSMLKFYYRSNKVWLLLKKDMAKYVSLKPSKKYPILNGKLECTFNAYELY
ncbi:MAG: THUMP domain-containing protein [Bacteroidales bacterium]|nr:THUMP domain-containing protein [Bacteroidales bacterium]